MFLNTYRHSLPVIQPSTTRHDLYSKKKISLQQQPLSRWKIWERISILDLNELRPTISADGNLLFFICENHPANTKYNSVRNSQDIWYSERDSTGKWSEAMHLGYPLNTDHYNAVYWISPDNNRILIRDAFIDGDYAGNGVSMSYLKEDGNWSKPECIDE